MISVDFDLSDQKKELLNTEGNILVIGGPGSGKTSIALLKAQEIILKNLNLHQRVLFLSFARATISRVEEKAKSLLKKKIKKQLEINTYHGFAWCLLKSHGYLLNDKTKIKLLPPPEAASLLAPFGKKHERNEEVKRLFREEGLLHFDLFASLTAKLLSKSNSLALIMSKAYPVIILDEFQDTNQSEWELIQELGKRSTLIVLGDTDQRIYEFRGADPARIGQFIAKYDLTAFDFSNENHRSTGTDIVQYGNDILNGLNKGKNYKNVVCKKYSYRRQHLHLDLKVEILEAIKRLNSNEGHKNWSLTILVPTKNLMILVSDYLSVEQSFSKGRLPVIKHDVSMETAGPSLAAVLIAKLLGKEGSPEIRTVNLIIDLCEHMRGRNGNKPPSKAVLKLTDSLIEYTKKGKVNGKNRKLIVEEAKRICMECNALVFSGEPSVDWVSVRKILSKSKSKEIRRLAEDSKYLCLLRKGAVLNAGLNELWRKSGIYDGSSELIRNALLQEHFSTTSSVWSGINIMTMHAAKGKEFDEVIIYDGPTKYRDKILKKNANENEIIQTRLTIRVAVTRAISKTTILTPSYDPCSLF